MNNILFEKKPSIKYQANPEAQSRFNTIVDNIDTVKLRYNNNELARRANIANAVCELSPDYKGMFEISPDAAFASFFGLEDSKSIDTMESVLKRVRQHTKDSQNALAEFKKLSRDEQDRIVKEHSPNAKKKEVRAGIYGIPSVAEVDNPEYDSEKERAEYEEKLKAKNTWESYLNIRNNFSTEVVSDAMRFVQASNDRSEAAYAHIDKFLAKDFEYKEQFLSAIHAFNPEIRAGFIERVKTRIGEGWTDSGQNLRDYFVERNKDSRILYGLAEEMGLVDKDGNLTADDSKLSELQKAYETKQNVALNRAMGAMGGMGMNNSVYQNTDVKKLFDEGKKAFERRKAIRTFLDANRTKFSYDNSEWQTFENALVNGEYVLRSLVVGFGATALTKNPYAGVVATMPMMYAEEASSMYADLRFNKNIKESDAIAGALFYGTTSTLLEQLQFSRFSKFFTKGSFIPETFKQYLAHGVKEASLRLGKETAIETFVEFGQASLGFATKAWAKNHTDDFELRPLWDEYCAEVSEVFKTMPIITSLMFGFGAPFRARGYLKNVGADFGSAIKAVYTPSDVFENNVKAKGTIDLANQYFDEVKSKLGNTASGREWLGKYFSATTEEEKTKLLNERYTDNNERYEAKMMLDQLADIDSKATQEWVKIKVEAAKKRADEANKILRGDTTDISLFDNEIVNEKGNRSYEVFESAVDALNMRSVVDSVNTAQELSDVAGISLNEAEEIIASKGHKGFFDEKNGKIIVINSHFKNGVDALQSFVHEYGHKIMKHIRETDANGYKRMCDNVLMLVGGEDFARSLLPASYSQEGHTNYEATAQGIAEETLMRVIEQVAYKKVLDTKKRSVWEHFKGWFKKFFDEKSLADITNEQLAEMALDVLQREKTFDVSLSSKPSKNWRAKTPEADGAEVSGEWSVMDASELLASTDKGYDDALQPRNRSRQSSKEQVLSIANNLDPERLDNDPTTSDGAPIIDDRNMVVSGNGRILAIRQAYEFGKADEYRRHVQSRAKAMGIDIPKGVKNPVLVRKVNNTGEMSIEELAARSNKSSVAGMSVAEQAVADGRRIIEHNLLEIFYPSADGNILAESNRDFNNAFLDMVGGGELYRNKDGSLRANLAPRVKAGVLAAMLNNDGNRDIVERLLDNPEGYSALINGLMQCAANVAELTQKPMYDISGDLSQAVELYIEMHEKGQTVAEFSAQMDMFREKPSDEVMFLCKLFEDNQRTSSGISGVLKEYASQCKKIDTATANLFGDEDPSKFDKLQSAYNHYATDIANQGGESTLKAKYDEEMPSPEEIAEAQRQYDEVVAKYKGTPQWLKAPNGKPTKLTEAQWIWVRTPIFKKWFGDWEKKAWAEEAIKFLENTPAVATLTGNEFQKDGVKLTEKVPEYFKSIGGIAHNTELGEVVLDLEGVKDSIAHGVSSLKASAFMAVKDVIEKGFIFNRETNWKNRNWDSAVIVAPIQIADENYICEVVVARRKNENRFYLHEVETKKTLDNVFKTSTEGRTSQASKLIIGKHLAEVKENVSKVVDENGEPLVVYHGTSADEPFWTFKKDGSQSQGTYLKGEQAFFFAGKDVADLYAKRLEPMATFLNIKNPNIVDVKNEIDEILWNYDGNRDEAIEAGIPIERWEGKSVESFEANDSATAYFDDNARDIFDNAKENGNDGIIMEGADGTFTYIAFNSNQIKSATDNVGTYSQRNDIRWKVDDYTESELNSIDDFYNKIKDGFVKNQNISLPIDENSDYKKIGDINKIDISSRLINELMNNGVSLRAIARKVLRPYYIYKKGNNYFVCVKLKNKTGNCVVLDAKINQGILSFLKNPTFAKEKDAIEKYNNLKQKERIVPLTGSVESSTARELEEQSYGVKLSKYSTRSQGKNSEKVEKAIFDAEKASKRLKNIDEVERMKNAVSTALRTLGLTVSERDSKSTTSKYLGIRFQDGTILQARVANHTGKRSIDITIEDDWKAGVRFVVDQLVNRGDWGTRENPFPTQSHLKFLLRQERSENPVYWASIVLAKEILRGRAITGAKLEKVLPSEKFDGTQRQYAIDRAKLIAEQCKATQEDYINRLDQAVKLAENDVYWTRDIVQEMNNSFRRDGEEYGIVRQKLTQWLKDEQRKDLEKVKGLTSSELGIDVAEAIENALEAEPERKKSESSVEEETEEEVSDDAEEGIDNELVGAVEKLAPSNIREIISKVRVGVLKAVKAKGGDEQTRRRVYRNTLVEVLREATKQLTYGKEREAIFAKISELATKGYAVIKIKDGERAGQKIDNYTLRAEHIALRIFNRGVRDTKEALLEKFEKLLKHAKAPARIKRDDKRKMTGKSEERAYIIKQIAYMPLNSDDKTVKSVESEIENTLAVINKADSSMANDYHAKLINAVQYLEDLQRFGALKEKSRAEMAEAIEWIEKFLESETEQHAEKVEKLKEDADRKRKIFLDAINENDHNANFDGKVRESFRYLLNSGSTFRDLLLGLGRSATGENSAKFRKLVEEMMNDCYRATAQKENEVFKFQNELTDVVKEIYGMNASDAFKHLLGSNEKLQEFSIQGKPMSVQIALQRLSMAEQRNYEHNVYIHCCGRSKEAKAIEQRIDELEEQKAETTDFEILKQIRADIKKLENELETMERNSVAEYVEKLRSALSEQDLKLLGWFREFYSREREHLSDANEVITGLGVPEADPLYTPMKMLREGGTNEKHQVVAIVPKSLSPRVPNALDMDENIGIVDIWNERIAENAHYKAFSQLNIEWRGIFAHADFHKAVNTKLGKNVLTQVLDHFNDIMSVSALGGLTIDTIDKLNGLYAIAALGFNLGSGLRQMTGASAFANFVGAKNTFKYAKDCLSKEGRQASIEILKSDIAKRRMQSGNNQVLLEALNNIEDNKFWAWYKRNAMFFNRWGDILPILTIGQGIYRSKTEEYAKSMSIEEAKKKAMNEMWAIAEASQQSPSVMNMGTWQRRGGSFGKAAGLFISSPQLMLSREVEVFNRFVSVRQKYKNNPNDESIRKDYFEARKMLAKTFFINHVLVQGGYMVATALWKALLGDDWDDDDCWAILAETIAGPLGGLVVFGRFVSAFYSNFSVSAMPIEGFGRTVKASIDLVQDLIMLDIEEIEKDLDRIAKTLFAPYRDASKIYKNAKDDKEGLIW